MNKDNILEVKDLHVDIRMAEGLLTAVRGVNFEMKKGETLGLVGESGCGKSLTSKAILGINDKKCQSTGQILFRDQIIFFGEKVFDMIEQDRAAAVHFKVEIAFGVDRGDKEFDAAVFADLFLIVTGAGDHILIFHLKHSADTVVIIEHADTHIRFEGAAAIEAVVNLEFIGTLPEFRIPSGIQRNGTGGTFHNISITHFIYSLIF